VPAAAGGGEHGAGAQQPPQQPVQQLARKGAGSALLLLTVCAGLVGLLAVAAAVGRTLASGPEPAAYSAWPQSSFT
jgi:hypothetical protein